MGALPRRAAAAHAGAVDRAGARDAAARRAARSRSRCANRARCAAGSTAGRRRASSGYDVRTPSGCTAARSIPPRLRAGRSCRFHLPQRRAVGRARLPHPRDRAPAAGRAEARMPFTLAHPAAILPLRSRYPAYGAADHRRRHPGPAVLRAGKPRRASCPRRTTSRVPTRVCLVLGYLVLARDLRAAPAADGAAVTARALAVPARARAAAPARPASGCSPGCAIVVGVWTHLLWDSFTHTDGWVVHRVAALSAPVHDRRPSPGRCATCCSTSVPPSGCS